jgi:hypothetical protein
MTVFDRTRRRRNHRCGRGAAGGLRLCAAAFTIVLGAAGAKAEASDPWAALGECARVTDGSARLACYDGVMAAFQGAAGRLIAPSAALPVSAAAAPSALTGEQAFGLAPAVVREKDTVRSPELERIEARVTALTSAGGRLVFSLDNGQEWRQFATSGDLLLNVGDKVVLSRGAVGSYWLKAASGRTTKVTRTR